MSSTDRSDMVRAMNKTENVQEQYKDDSNLSVRIGFHVKYSTNRQGLIPWLFEKYEFANGDRVLELGCGNGGQWENRIQSLPADCTLVLSDFSEGMVRIVWDKYKDHKNLLPAKIDIQNIPFPDHCFDVVIANYMLYHIPDIDAALREVKRILKPNGRFYSATNGNGGMRPFLRNAFQQVNPLSRAFTKDFTFSLQNGSEILSKYFDRVRRFDYENALIVTETKGLLDWLKSNLTMSAYTESDLDGLYEYFESIRQREGAIHLPQETGLFVSTNI